MKIVSSLVGLIVVLVGGFLVLNNFIYTEKQGEQVAFDDGEYLGFIHALTDNDTSLDFDDALWLNGEAAQNAAIETGLCTEETREECTPNDYFIKNEIEQNEHLGVSPYVSVVMQTWRMEETGQVMAQPITLTEFSELINDSSLHWDNLPYRVTVVDKTVTRIEEVYVP